MHSPKLSKVTRSGVLVLPLVLSLALSTNALPTSSVTPRNYTNATSVNLQSLYSEGPDGFGINIWISNLTSTVFGEDATDFDYHLAGGTAGAIESVLTLGNLFSTGNADEVLTAFLNTTMGGTMTVAQAADKEWLCNELSGSMSSYTEACAGVALTFRSTAVLDEQPLESETSDLLRRVNSRWRWIISGAHVSSKFVMEVVQRNLESQLYADFAKSPRSYCDKVNSVMGCISWSKVESFNHYYAQQLVSDALSAVDFNMNSAQVNGILGSRKRSGADVCLSNRADGCT